MLTFASILSGFPLSSFLCVKCGAIVDLDTFTVNVLFVPVEAIVRGCYIYTLITRKVGTLGSCRLLLVHTSVLGHRVSVELARGVRDKSALFTWILNVSFLLMAWKSSDLYHSLCVTLKLVQFERHI